VQNLARASNVYTLPRAFRRIRLEVVGEPRRRGYVFVAPLDAAGRLDSGLWKEHCDECRVVRFRPNDEDVGHLIHRPEGGWAFRYDIDGDEADEAVFRFAHERFEPGEYVSIKEDTEVHTLRVSSVEHLCESNRAEPRGDGNEQLH
jgi:hypothetical protein